MPLELNPLPAPPAPDPIALIGECVDWARARVRRGVTHAQALELKARANSLQRDLDRILNE